MASRIDAAVTHLRGEFHVEPPETHLETHGRPFICRATRRGVAGMGTFVRREPRCLAERRDERPSACDRNAEHNAEHSAARDHLIHGGEFELSRKARGSVGYGKRAATAS